MKRMVFTALCALLFAGSFASAQEFDFGTDSSDSGDFGGFGSAAEPALTWSGEVGAKARTWLDTEDGYSSFSDFFKSDTSAGAYLKLGFEYSGSRTDIDVKLKVDTDTIKEHPEDVLDEATVRGHFGNLTVEAGKMKSVWGKGDKLHVLDNFNANDYTDFIFPDYIDRRIAEPMLKLSYALPSDANLKIEGVYTPLMTADRFATGGRLQPHSQKLIEGAVSAGAASMMAHAAEPARTLFLMNAASLASDTDSLYPDTRRLKYGQFGARVTGTLAGFDLGASYYYGHKKQPSLNMGKLASYLAKRLSGQASGEDDKFLDYDTLHVFGLEMAKVIWKLNTRWELAYNMTNDFDGSNPNVFNNSVAWLAGFDIDLPLHNLNLNVQETGTAVLATGDLKNNVRNQGWDVDYNKDGRYVNNKLVALLKDTFMNEKISIELQGIWGIENKEFVIIPKFTFTVIDGLSFSGQVAFMRSETSYGEIFNFVDAQDDDSGSQMFAQLGVKYTF